MYSPLVKLGSICKNFPQGPKTARHLTHCTDMMTFTPNCYAKGAVKGFSFYCWFRHTRSIHFQVPLVTPKKKSVCIPVFSQISWRCSSQRTNRTRQSTLNFYRPHLFVCSSRQLGHVDLQSTSDSLETGLYQIYTWTEHIHTYIE